jgi:hypothetical protein
LDFRIFPDELYNLSEHKRDETKLIRESKATALLTIENREKLKKLIG